MGLKGQVLDEYSFLRHERSSYVRDCRWWRNWFDMLGEDREHGSENALLQSETAVRCLSRSAGVGEEVEFEIRKVFNRRI